MLVQVKAKGVEGLIPVENPNRVAAKAIKAKNVDVNAQVTLSRRERYAILVPASVRVSVRVSTCVCVCVGGCGGVCVCVWGVGVCVCVHMCVLIVSLIERKLRSKEQLNLIVSCTRLVRLMRHDGILLDWLLFDSKEKTLPNAEKLTEKVTSQCTLIDISYHHHCS